MRKRRTLIAGVLCGILCALCMTLFLYDVEARTQVTRAEALARYGGEQLEVCVAKRDIAAGETVAAADVETKLWVADLLPAGAVRSADEVLGKQPSSAILQGEVFSTKRFEHTTQALDIPSGLAAVSVPARDVQAVGGALRPGMRVDVYSTGQTTTQRILSRALVISTNGAGSDEGAAGEALSWVTLAVSPESVREVVTAAQTSDIYFTLPGEAVSDADKDTQTEGDDGEESESAAESGATSSDSKAIDVRSGSSDATKETDKGAAGDEK